MHNVINRLQKIQRPVPSAILLYAICVLTIIAAYQWLTPDFQNAVYSLHGPFTGAEWNKSIYEVGSGANVVPQMSSNWGIARWEAIPHDTEYPFEMPLVIASGGSEIRIKTEMHVARLHPTKFLLVVDDCIRGLRVNGTVVNDTNYCSLDEYTIDLGPYLHMGINHIETTIEDNGGWGIFRLTAAPNDILFWMLRSFFFFATLVFGWFLLHTYRAKRSTVALFVLVLAGAFWLKCYDANFSYYHQSRDWDGHLDYVVYVREHWNIPPAGEDHPKGWEYYQPPVYYFLLAAWGGIGSALGRSEQLILQDYEVISWFMVVCALAVSALIAWQLFQNREMLWARYAFVACIATFPTIVYFSGIISNDVLFYLMGVLITFTILLWWRTKQHMYWYITATLIGIGLLVKSNLMPFIAVLGICLLLDRSKTRETKIRLGGEALGIILLLAGWYLVMRFIVEGETFIVGNTLTHHLGVENNISNFLTFNPFKVIFVPFNENWDNAFRRQFFWEYVFRSSFFSEFRFGDRYLSLASFLLFTGMALIPVTLYGLVVDIRNRARFAVPMLSILLCFLIALIAYRIISPFSPNQDFRFIAPATIPIMYYMLRGIHALPDWGKQIGKCLVFTLILTSLFSIWLLIQRY